MQRNEDHLPTALTVGTFSNGVIAALPVCLPTVLLYIIFGVMAEGAGVPFIQALITTVFVFSSPIQFTLLQSEGQGVILIPLLLALSARFSIMSAALVPYLRIRSLPVVMTVVLFVVPPTFAISIARFPRLKSGFIAYFLGVGIPIYLTAIFGTGLGYVVQFEVPLESISQFSSFILALLFALLAAQLWQKRMEVASFVLGAAMAPLCFGLFGSLALIVCPIWVGGMLFLLEKHWAVAKEGGQ